MGKGAGEVLGKIAPIAGLASPLLGAGFGIANMIAGSKQANDAKNALENYERQRLNNIADGLQVSTLGSDLQREEQSRMASSQVGALREGGARTMIGGLGRVQQGNQLVNRQIGADLDMQQKQIDQMRAEDEARIRAMQENREIADISALSSQVNTGEQVKSNGISQGIQGISMLGNAFAPRVANNQYPTDSNKFSTSGTPTNIPNTYSTPDTMRYASESGYATEPTLTNPAYNPMNYGAQNHPLANQIPYGQLSKVRNFY